MATTIIVVIVGMTWFLGERNGWSEIGTGGQNRQLIPRIGDEAPELFTLREDGTPMQLSALRGQPVWINFWGSWCAPCRSEFPDIARAYDTLTPQGLQIISISIDEAPQKAIDYRNRAGADFPVYIDPSFIESFLAGQVDDATMARFQDMRNDWQIANFPTHVFIGADGIVKDVVIAQMTYDEAIERGENTINAPRTSITGILPPRSND